MSYKLVLPKVNGSHGSPMGRSSYNDLPHKAIKVHLNYVPFIDGAYDRGGAYWGCPANLYCAEFQIYNEQEDKEYEGCCFVRASSRTEAKETVRKISGWEFVKFYK